MSKLDDAKTGYTFDDVVLVPQYSEIKSRKDPDITVPVDGFNYKLPVISAPMATVTETDMMVAMWSIGATSVLHRYMDIDSQVEMVKRAQERLVAAGANTASWTKLPPFYAAVGANGDVEERTEALYEAGVNGFCVDVANGHNELSVQAVRKVRSIAPDAKIMAGNVCSFEGAYRLAEAGADALRVGVGGGSVCDTRGVTGHGVPQLTAIEDCLLIKSREAFRKAGHSEGTYLNSYPHVAIISDGGVRRSGDVVKSLALGADAVMIGGMLAACIETAGEFIEEDGVLYKYFQGMASEEARAKYMSKPKIGVPAEGVSKKILYSGRSAVKIVQDLCASVKVGLSYSGAHDIRELRRNAVFMKVTNAGYVEGTPHKK